MPRTENRVFFPQAALDRWIVDGTVDLQDGELTILCEGRRFTLTEAVRVLGEVSGSGGGGAEDLVGRVNARSSLEQLGAEMLETSMLLGDAAYDIEPGWVGVPIGTFEEHIESEARKAAQGVARRPVPTSDEDLLAKFLAENG